MPVVEHNVPEDPMSVDQPGVSEDPMSVDGQAQPEEPMSGGIQAEPVEARPMSETVFQIVQCQIGRRSSWHTWWTGSYQLQRLRPGKL